MRLVDRADTTWGPLPVIEGVVTLRPWLDEDAAFVAEAFADADIRQWHSFARLDPIEWMIQRRRRWDEHRGADWAVERDGELVGRAALPSFDVAHRLATIGYWTHPAHRGTGVAGDAVATLTDWAFDEGLHRIQLEHAVLNEASCAVATRCGYIYEGTARESWPHDGSYLDMHIHARLASDRR